MFRQVHRRFSLSIQSEREDRLHPGRVSLGAVLVFALLLPLYIDEPTLTRAILKVRTDRKAAVLVGTLGYACTTVASELLIGVAAHAQCPPGAVPADGAIDASVEIGPIPAGFGVAVRLAISLPGMDRGVAQDLIDAAHQVYP